MRFCPLSNYIVIGDFTDSGSIIKRSLIRDFLYVEESNDRYKNFDFVI